MPVCDVFLKVTAMTRPSFPPSLTAWSGRMFGLLLLAGSMASSTVAETFRWTDPRTGQTVISDQPPPGVRRTRPLTGTPEAENSQQKRYAAQQAATRYPVTLYTAPECVTDCKQARELLTRRGVPFSEKMMQKREDIDALKQLVGDAFVPSLQVGSQAAKGYQPEAWHNLLDLAGYPK